MITLLPAERRSHGADGNNKNDADWVYWRRGPGLRRMPPAEPMRRQKPGVRSCNDCARSGERAQTSCLTRSTISTSMTPDPAVPIAVSLSMDRSISRPLPFTKSDENPPAEE